MCGKRLAVVVCLFLGSLVSIKAQAQETSRPRMSQTALPMVFEPAAPQPENAVAMVGRVAGGAVDFRPTAIDIHSARGGSSFTINFDGAQRSAPVALHGLNEVAVKN